MLPGHQKIATVSVGHQSALLGDIRATGAAAAGMTSAVGIAQTGIEKSPWYSSSSSSSSSSSTSNATDQDAAVHDLNEYGLRRNLIEKFARAVKDSKEEEEQDAKESSGRGKGKGSGPFTALQVALLPLFLSYVDVLYHGETIENHQAIVRAYALHAINHIYRYV
jgi:hypothetical protein